MDYMELIRQTDEMDSEQDIIDGIMPKDSELIILAGRPGIGKTWMLTQLAFCLANGANFLIWKIRQTKPYLVYFEGGQKKLANRLISIDEHFSDPEHFDVDIKGTMFLDTPEGQLKIKELLDSVVEKGVKVILFDPLRFLISRPDNQTAVIKAITVLKQSHKEYGMNFILSAHIKKPSQDERYRVHPGDMYNVKNFTDWVDTAQTVFILERPDMRKKKIEGFNRVLYLAKGRDVEVSDEIEEGIMLNMKNGFFTVMGYV